MAIDEDAAGDAGPAWRARRGRLATLRWAMARLRSMSLREIAHRLAEAREKARWGRGVARWDASIDDGPLPPCELLRIRLARGAALAGVSASRAASAAGRLTAFGRDWPAVSWKDGAGSAFWLHDPVTKRLWPGAATPFADVGARATGSDPAGPSLGDVKFVWEPARLQMLHPLAAAAAAGDAAAGETALAILRDFAVSNPPYGGVHWVSGVEMALRLVSVTLLCAALGPDGIGPDDRALIRRLAAAHGRHLAAFPSLHSSANNHRVAEGLGLFLAGFLAPDIGPGWEDEGRAILEAEALRQILPDGVGAEQALTYQAFAMEMIAFAALIAEESGRPLATAALERVALGAAFLKAMLDSGGRAPAIGDDDETRAIAQPPDREPRYAASVVAAIAGLTGRPDLLPALRDPHLRDALFAAPEGAGETREGARTFRDGGYTTVHETIAGRRIDLVFDHGPLGYLSLAAHGHADALALWLSVDGEAVLIDPGTYLYHSGGDLRLRLRESQGHNTLSVARASQSRASSAFGWSSRAGAALVEARPGPDWSVTAEHDGYRRRFSATHRRRAERTREGIAIHDSLHGAGAPLPVEIGFLVPGDLHLALAGESVTIARAGSPLCRLAAPAGFSIALRRGAAEGAIRSRRFGEIEDAQRIALTGLLGDGQATTHLMFSRAGRAKAAG